MARSPFTQRFFTTLTPAGGTVEQLRSLDIVQSREFTSAFENAAIGMSVVTPDARRIRVNRAMCQMLGYTEAELMALPITHITHPDDHARDTRERELCLAGHKHSFQYEKRFVRKDGALVWGHLTCTLVQDDDGRPLHFITQVVDITDRKLAQEELQAAQSLLHMAAQMGRLGAFASSRDEDKVMWSPEICAIFDVKPGFQPTRMESLRFFAPAHRAAMRERLLQCARDGTPFDAEAQVVTARGRELWVRVICEAEWDSRGKVKRMHGACQDITDAKRAAGQQQAMLERVNAELEKRVRERTAQLEAANRELEAFSYSIAHDLRAPLGAIDGFSSVLEECVGTTPERAMHYLARIRANVRQMADLTDGLLALANLSRMELRNDGVDLADLARAAVAQLRDASPQRRVHIAIAPRLPARGDARLLSQVMGNLVGNAWKFTSRKDDACIEIGAKEDVDGQPVYFVRDNGAGFDMEYAHRLFEAFQRLHSASEFEGTGIGLAIVHKIVQRHGGRIWAESVLGSGATFHFTLAR